MVYAGDDNDYVVSALGANSSAPPTTPQTFNQTALSPPEASMAKNVGLNATQTNTASVWCCPDLVRYGTFYNPTPGGSGGPQWQIGYQYFGGIYWWYNSFYQGIKSASPIKMSTSNPLWVLASDLICKYTAGTGNPWGASTGGFVAHQRHGARFPDGGNHLTMDGSVHWIEFENTYAITTFEPGVYNYYFYQQDIGTMNSAVLPALQAQSVAVAIPMRSPNQTDWRESSRFGSTGSTISYRCSSNFKTSCTLEILLATQKSMAAVELRKSMATPGSASQAPTSLK